MHVTINVTYMYGAKTFLTTGCFKTTCRVCAGHETCTAQIICAKKIMTRTKELNFCVGESQVFVSWSLLGRMLGMRMSVCVAAITVLGCCHLANDMRSRLPF